MLKKTITFTDFNGVEHTEDFYFHLSRTELVGMEASVEGGLREKLLTIVATEDTNQLFKTFKEIILASVGKRSKDGQQFEKSPEIVRAFESSPAFDVLFMELATDAEKASEFANGVIPPDLAKGFDAPGAVEHIIPAKAESSSESTPAE
jgi:hypothetical protein